MKQKIISELKKLQIPNMLSMSIVGSFVARRKLGGAEDVDVYLILDSIDAAAYKKIMREFEGMCEHLSSEDTLLTAEFRAGPFKPRFEEGRRCIQIHVLINTLDMLANKSNMVALDWKLSSIKLKGKEISKFLKADKFSSQELVNGRDGLLYFLELLNSGRKAWMEWVVRGNELQRVRKDVELASKIDWFELIQFVTIQGFTNFVRLHEAKFFKTEQNISSKARALLPKEHFAFLQGVLNAKKKLREEGTIKYDVSRLKKGASSFIEYLVSQAR